MQKPVLQQWQQRVLVTLGSNHPIPSLVSDCLLPIRHCLQFGAVGHHPPLCLLVPSVLKENGQLQQHGSWVAFQTARLMLAQLTLAQLSANVWQKELGAAQQGTWTEAIRRAEPLLFLAAPGASRVVPETDTGLHERQPG